MVKVGDKIKVVNANISGGRYKNGDVFTVLSVKEYGIVFVKEHDQCIWDSEYEVVESEDKPMVKVGDKIKIVNAKLSSGEYKNGDVFTVIGVLLSDNVFVKEHDVIIWPIEYDVIKEKPKTEIKSGDTVKLIDKFYEHDAFKELSRDHRKDIANQAGKELKLTFVCDGRVCYTAENQGAKSIPIELLEKAEQLPKPGDLFKVIHKGIGYHHFEIGEVVEFIKDETSMGMYLLRGYSKDRNEVCDQVLYRSDIEPYTKHRYTDEQIAEAEQIIGKIVASLPDWDTFFFRREGSETMIYASGNANKQNSAKCMETDEYNQTIGRMITLCKHVGRPLPEWL
jgi:hypothetical protein